jgi:hypothetical protein
MGLREMGLRGKDWIYLAEDRDRWRAVVNAVMSIRLPQNSGNFLSSWGPVSFSGRSLIRGVSCECAGESPVDYFVPGAREWAWKIRHLIPKFDIVTLTTPVVLIYEYRFITVTRRYQAITWHIYQHMVKPPSLRTTS